MPEMTDNAARPDLARLLRTARGHYSTDRAAQLSGIPKSTLYEWRRRSVYLPDFGAAKPMAWSYRDLVYVRVLAWLRSEAGTPRPVAAERVRLLKEHVAAGRPVTRLSADRDTLVVDDDLASPLHGHGRLFSDLLENFDLDTAAKDFAGRTHLWGPDLVTPSPHTAISPWVLGGDPCITRTRIPSASIFALRSERGLTVADVVSLYEGLDKRAVEDAYHLEQRLRGTELQVA